MRAAAGEPPPSYAGDAANSTHIQCALIKVILTCGRGRNLISAVFERTRLPYANLVKIATDDKEATVHRRWETRAERAV